MIYYCCCCCLRGLISHMFTVNPKNRISIFESFHWLCTTVVITIIMIGVVVRICSQPDEPHSHLLLPSSFNFVESSNGLHFIFRFVFSPFFFLLFFLLDPRKRVVQGRFAQISLLGGEPPRHKAFWRGPCAGSVRGEFMMLVLCVCVCC